MSMIFITETLGKFKSVFPAFHNIFIVQNVEMLIEILLFLLVYHFSVRGLFLKRTIKVMIIIYILVAVCATLIWQPLDQMFPTYSLVTGGIFILVAIQLYFYEGIKNMQEQSFYKSYLFYISIGLFIFYANEMPVMTLFNYFLQNNTSVDKIMFIFNLKLIVSTIFYSLYSFGILWTTKK
ncbi:MAG: hypothetical protein JNL13_10555 [Chitinophagaceae bacterium]|nr:hypothetical protein [Chitinophagaceae bacterium]